MSKENVIIASKKEIEKLGKQITALNAAFVKVVAAFTEIAGAEPTPTKKKKRKANKTAQPEQQTQAEAPAAPVPAVATATPVKATPKAAPTKAATKLPKLPAKANGSAGRPSMPAGAH